MKREPKIRPAKSVGLLPEVWATKQLQKLRDECVAVARATTLEQLSSLGREIRELQSNLGKVWAELRKLKLREEPQELEARLAGRITFNADSATAAIMKLADRILELDRRLDYAEKIRGELSVPEGLEKLKETILEPLRALTHRVNRLEDPDRAPRPAPPRPEPPHQVEVDAADPDTVIFALAEAMGRARAAKQGGTIIELVVYPDGTHRLRDLPKDTKPGRYWARLGISGRSTR